MLRLDIWLIIACLISSLLTLLLLVLSYLKCPKCKKRKKLNDWGDKQLCTKCEGVKYFGF